MTITITPSTGIETTDAQVFKGLLEITHGEGLTTPTFTIISDEAREIVTAIDQAFKGIHGPLESLNVSSTENTILSNLLVNKIKASTYIQTTSKPTSTISLQEGSIALDTLISILESTQDFLDNIDLTKEKNRLIKKTNIFQNLIDIYESIVDINTQIEKGEIPTDANIIKATSSVFSVAAAVLLFLPPVSLAVSVTLFVGAYFLDLYGETVGENETNIIDFYAKHIGGFFEYLPPPSCKHNPPTIYTS